MDPKVVLAVFAGLTSASLTLGCDKHGSKSDVTEVPETVGEPTTDGEHACGNHAEGACGGESDGAPVAGAAATTRDFDVNPGAFAEVNFKMAKGSTVTATFAKATSDLTWNVHSHDHSGGTKIHDEGSAREGKVVFTATEDGVFSILWKNEAGSATPLDVVVELAEGATIHSWMPAE